MSVADVPCLTDGGVIRINTTRGHLGGAIGGPYADYYVCVPAVGDLNWSSSGLDGGAYHIENFHAMIGCLIPA